MRSAHLLDPAAQKFAPEFNIPAKSGNDRSAISYSGPRGRGVKSGSQGYHNLWRSGRFCGKLLRSVRWQRVLPISNECPISLPKPLDPAALVPYNDTS